MKKILLIIVALTIQLSAQSILTYFGNAEYYNANSQASAINALEKTDKARTIILGAGSYDFGTVTVSDSVTLVIMRDAVIYNSALTVNGYFDAGRYQVFDTTCTITISDENSAKEIYPEWFGAVADSTLDCSKAVDMALELGAASRIPVSFVPAEYYLLTPISITLGSLSNYHFDFGGAKFFGNTSSAGLPNSIITFIGQTDGSTVLFDSTGGQIDTIINRIAGIDYDVLAGFNYVPIQDSMDWKAVVNLGDAIIFNGVDLGIDRHSSAYVTGYGTETDVFGSGETSQVIYFSHNMETSSDSGEISAITKYQMLPEQISFSNINLYSCNLWVEGVTDLIITNINAYDDFEGTATTGLLTVKACKGFSVNGATIKNNSGGTSRYGIAITDCFDGVLTNIIGKDSGHNITISGSRTYSNNITVANSIFGNENVEYWHAASLLDTHKPAVNITYNNVTVMNGSAGWLMRGKNINIVNCIGLNMSVFATATSEWFEEPGYFHIANCKTDRLNFLNIIGYKYTDIICENNTAISRGGEEESGTQASFISAYYQTTYNTDIDRLLIRGNDVVSGSQYGGTNAFFFYGRQDDSTDTDGSRDTYDTLIIDNNTSQLDWRDIGMLGTDYARISNNTGIDFAMSGTGVVSADYDYPYYGFVDFVNNTDCRFSNLGGISGSNDTIPIDGFFAAGNTFKSSANGEADIDLQYTENVTINNNAFFVDGSANVIYLRIRSIQPTASIMVQNNSFNKQDDYGTGVNNGTIFIENTNSATNTILQFMNNTYASTHDDYYQAGKELLYISGFSQSTVSGNEFDIQRTYTDAVSLIKLSGNSYSVFMNNTLKYYNNPNAYNMTIVEDTLSTYLFFIDNIFMRTRQFATVDYNYPYRLNTTNLLAYSGNKIVGDFYYKPRVTYSTFDRDYTYIEPNQKDVSIQLYIESDTSQTISLSDAGYTSIDSMKLYAMTDSAFWYTDSSIYIRDAGNYQVNVQISWLAPATGGVVHTDLFVNGSEASHLAYEGDIDNNAESSKSFMGEVRLSAGDYIQIKAQSDASAADYIIKYLQFHVVKLSD